MSEPIGEVTVAVDAMGGDHAPAAVVAGACAVHGTDGIHVVLVGDAGRIEPELPESDPPAVVHAPEVVGMDEEPAVAIRRKRGSSIRVAAEMVAEGEADALVSAGSTGATVAAGLLVIGRRGGVRRPAVAAEIPLSDGSVVLVDAGGNVDVQPDALFAYGLMGQAYASALGVGRPAVGLLNIGAEPGKGNELARAAFDLLGELDGFAGNVEPHAILGGAVDVVVADGFTGNVFLKTIEACTEPGGHAAGAGIVLGVAREVLVAHGAADAEAVAAAIRTAARMRRARMAERIAEVLEQASPA